MLIMEQSKQVTIRQGDIDDAPRILEFFNKEYPQYKRDREFWHWINIVLGDSDSLITIAECDGRVVGHYCVIPRTLMINEQSYSVGMGIHAIIDKDYRKYTSIIEITNHAKKLAKEFGMVMLYGFPNQNYHIIQEKIERWDVVSRFDSIDFTPQTYDSNLELISPIDITKYEFENLMQSISPKKYMVSLKKEPSYYYNRYINHPHSLYDSLFVYQNGKFSGVVTLKTFQGTTGHIIDSYVNFDITEYDLIQSCLNQFKLEKISLWTTNVNFKSALLNTISNYTKGFRTNFLVKFIDSDFENTNKNRILDIYNWDLPMGTSDAF